MITDHWIRRLEEAYMLQRGERLNELHGVRVRRFDDRGLHPESIVWGAIQQLHDLEPDLAVAGADPVLFRAEARRDAEETFRATVLEEARRYEADLKELA